MKTVRNCITEAINAGTIKNKAEIARRLKISEAAVSRWWHEQCAPDEDQAAALAALLQKPEVMPISAASRAKTKEGRNAWAKVATLLATAAAVMMIIALPYFDTDTQTAKYDNREPLYIM